MGELAGDMPRCVKKVNKRLNVLNLGVDLDAVQEQSSSNPWEPPRSSKRAPGWSPCTGLTPTTPQAPTSPFVGAVWGSLNDQQKTHSLSLGPHLVQASWILLRRRAIGLFTARALRQAEHDRYKNRLMSEAVARKEREIEAIMAQENTQDWDEAPSPRRALPRRASLTATPKKQSVGPCKEREIEAIMAQKNTQASDEAPSPRRALPRRASLTATKQSRSKRHCTQHSLIQAVG